MDIFITKEEHHDSVTVQHRSGGGALTFNVPHKGPVPHDAVHFHVETCLGLPQGFWGLIASGTSPADVQAMAAIGGHASAKRAQIPVPSVVQLIQAERITESFEANLWGGGTDPAPVRAMAISGCEASHVPAPEMSDEAIGTIIKRVSDLHASWSALAFGETLRLCWPNA